MANVFRLTTLYRIERTDGVVLRFTDHTTSIEFEDEMYFPSGTIEATDRQMQTGLKPSNMDIKSGIDVHSVLDHNSISHAELVEGRFRDAEVREILVDWLYPWAGAYLQTRYWMDEIRYDGEIWQATLLGITRRLGRPVGDLYGKSCMHALGDSVCRVDIESMKQTAVSVTATSSSPNRVFTASSLTQDEDHWAYGEMIWTLGNNVGLKNVVATSTNTGVLTLTYPAAWPVEVGDEFNVYPGCNKTHEMCSSSKFASHVDPISVPNSTNGNLPNFGGFPYIPGKDKMLMTPNTAGKRLIEKLLGIPVG